MGTAGAFYVKEGETNEAKKTEKEIIKPFKI